MLKQKKSCKDAALGLLARREHSSAELKRKLAQKGYDREEIAEVLEYFKELGYLSDGRFAQAYARELIERKRVSDSAARMKLSMRGVSREEADEAVRMASQVYSETRRIEELLQKWGRTGNEEVEEENDDNDDGNGAEGGDARKKIIAKLLRLGYSYEVVKKGLKIDERR